MKKLFDRLRKYQLPLNPAKCTFRAKSGKLLDFIVSKRGIEVDHDKVMASQEMPIPRIDFFLNKRIKYVVRTNTLLLLENPLL